jgi:cyclopropane fatty-acyl-phospholipid synthase-like methyltransferase
MYTGDNASDPSELYSETYFTGGEYAAYDQSVSCHRRNFRRKLRLLERHGAATRRPWRLLEVGCATGEFMHCAAEESGTVAIGIEASEYCRRIGAERGMKMVSPTDPALPSLLADLKPNLIVAWDVWEHLAQPAEIFDSLLEYMSHDAILAVSTVDAESAVARWRGTRWRQFHPPTHLNYPTGRSLRLYLESRGFQVTYQKYFGYYRPFIQYLQPLHMSELVNRQSWLAAVPIYLNLFDTQLVIASRSKH